MTIDLVVRPGVDSAFIAWRAPIIATCRGFALARRIKRAAGSAPSPEQTGDDGGFAVEPQMLLAGDMMDPVSVRNPTMVPGDD